MQDHLLVLAQELPYTKAHQIAQRLLGQTISRNSLYRLTVHYGEAIAPALTQAPEPVVTQDPVVYAMADGLMLLFDEGYKETKLGRTFSAETLVSSTVADRARQISSSDYIAYVGSWSDLWALWQVHLWALVAAGKELVFISDGVVWLHEQLKESYPNSVMILDIYHAMEHLGEAARAGIGAANKRKLWLSKAYNYLINS